MKKEIKWIDGIPCMQIFCVLAPMMAIARGWKTGIDFETQLRMANKYIQVASYLN
jgi:hypothetical protein